MLELVVQLTVIGIWTGLISIYIRRLMRLTRQPLADGSPPRLRQRLARVWWWLGREEYWRALHADGLQAGQLTVLVFMLLIGLHG